MEISHRGIEPDGLPDDAILGRSNPSDSADEGLPVSSEREPQGATGESVLRLEKTGGRHRRYRQWKELRSGLAAGRIRNQLCDAACAHTSAGYLARRHTMKAAARKLTRFFDANAGWML